MLLVVLIKARGIGSHYPHTRATFLGKISHIRTNHSEQPKISSDFNRLKQNASDTGKYTAVCYVCKKPGHVLARCRKRQAKVNINTLEKAFVQLLSTLQEPSLVEPLSPKELSPDPRFEHHCTEAELV